MFAQSLVVALCLSSSLMLSGCGEGGSAGNSGGTLAEQACSEWDGAQRLIPTASLNGEALLWRQQFTAYEAATQSAISTIAQAAKEDPSWSALLAAMSGVGITPGTNPRLGTDVYKANLATIDAECRRARA
jgi:hypothetical protein